MLSAPLSGVPSASLAAQEGCQFGDEGNDALDRQMLSGGATITYVSNPHFVCADGVRIWADSAVAYSAQGMSHLMGSVRYVDPTRELRADEARYFSRQERVQAHGQLYVRDVADGSVIENGELVYLRSAAFRDEESMTVTTGADGVRPVARLQPAAPDAAASLDETPGGAAGGGGGPPPSDSAAADAGEGAGGAPATPGARDPYTVVADRILLQGSARFEATGHVEIERDSLLAFADSAEYDRVGDRVVLRGSAHVEGPAYDLRGRTIDLLTPEAATSEVHAIRDAVLTSEDLVITSSRIRLYLTDGALDRLVATPLPEDTALTAAAGTPDAAGGQTTGEGAASAVPAAPVPPPGAGTGQTAPTAGKGGAGAPGAADRPYPAGLPAAADSVTGPGVADPFAAAAHPGQPVALVEQFRLTADSIDILAPGERIERVFAGGRARSVSHARDSLNVEDLPPIARADWLEGDTVIVYFEPEPADSTGPVVADLTGPVVADSMWPIVQGPERPATAEGAEGEEARYRVDRIRALVGARSLYRLAPADSAARAGVDPPAIHYVVGDSITVVMDGDEVERMDVVGQTQGVHLEPLSPRRAAPDSLRDTTGVELAPPSDDATFPPDTGTVRGVPPAQAAGPGTGARSEPAISTVPHTVPLAAADPGRGAASASPGFQGVPATSRGATADGAIVGAAAISGGSGFGTGRSPKPFAPSPPHRPGSRS